MSEESERGNLDRGRRLTTPTIGMYRHGTLAERATRWEAERALEPVFVALMAEAKRRTDERIFPTGDYDMKLNLVRNISYTARCNFDERLMDLNADLEFTRSALFPQQAWLDGRIRFASHPFRGAFIASYWFGDEAVRAVRERTPRSRFPAFVEELYGNLNTPKSLRAFS